jgi:hypothetical protein
MNVRTEKQQIGYWLMRKMVSSSCKYIYPRMRVSNDDPVPATKKKKAAARATKKKKTAASAAKKKIKTGTEYEYPKGQWRILYPTRVCFDCNTNTTPLWRSDPTGSKVIS